MSVMNEAKQVQVFHGSFVDVGSEAGSLAIVNNAWISVDTRTGIIVDVTVVPASSSPPPSLPATTNPVIHLPPTHLLCPGFIDTHVHAAQLQYQGTGTDLPLMQWLEKYAFPSERRLTNDLQLSHTVYSKLVQTLLRNGTTTCLYFGVMGLESTKVLVDVVREQGQRALIGKVNMNRLAPSDYCETTEESLAATTHFIDYVRQQQPNNGLVAPVITPRFVPSCTEELLVGLGELAASTGCRVQSHAVESVDCLKTVQALEQDGRDEVQLLASSGLLTDKSVMAHCVHLSDSHAATFLERGVGIAHCPLSNFYFAGGALRTRALMDQGLKMGLGTDVAGGYSHQMLSSMRHSVTTHLAVCSADANAGGRCHGVAPGAGSAVKRSSYDYKHAFWLATVGGARVLGLDGKVGRLATGYEFDALLLDLASFQDPLGEDSHATTFEKFLHLGDDRHVEKVWVQGNQVK